jgi:hypothetical protein
VREVTDLVRISKKKVLYAYAAILLLLGVQAYFMLGHSAGVKSPKNVPGLDLSK